MWVFFDLISLMMLVFGTFLVVGTSSWFVVWLGLEVNMVSFISLIGGGSDGSASSCFKYFLVQVVGSLFLLFFVLLNEWLWFISVEWGDCWLSWLIIMLMVWKLGGGPFYFWFSSLAIGMSWYSLLVLMSWQKIAPLWVMSVLSVDEEMVVIFGVVSVIIGSLLGVNQLILRLVLVYSSVVHLGWMMVLISMSESVMVLYYVSYVVLVVSIVACLMSYNLVHVYDVYLFGGLIGFSFFVFLLLLSLGGMPPLLGFFPKWVGLVMMIGGGYFILVFFMILMTVIGLYYYLRVCYMSLVSGGSVLGWVGVDMSFSVVGVIFGCFMVIGYFFVVFLI